MPGGRGRGLRQNQSLVALFNDPAVIEKQFKNVWDDPKYAWSKPKGGGNEQLRNYLTNSDYWGYQGWDPEEQGGGRYIDRGGDQDLLEYMDANPNFDRDRLPKNSRIQYPSTPEANIEYRLRMLHPVGGSNISPAQRRYQYQKAKKYDAEILQRMKAEYRKSMGEDYLGEFSTLDRLRYMEEKRISVPWGEVPYTGKSVWAGHYGTGGGAGATGGGGQEGGGKGGVGNRSLSPGAPRPSVTPSPVSPRPQYTAPQAGRQQAPMARRGPVRALGPRSPRRSVPELFNGTGAFGRATGQRRNIWQER